MTTQRLKLSVFLVVLLGSSTAMADKVLDSLASCRCGDPYRADPNKEKHGSCDPVGSKIVCRCDKPYHEWENKGGAYYCLPECPGDTVRKDYDVCEPAARVNPPLQLRPVPNSSVAAVPVKRRPPKLPPCEREPLGAECSAIAQRAIDAQNWSQAAPSLRLICKAGNASGCRALAVVASKGALSADVKREAQQLLDGTCDRGDADACLDLARFYATGELLRVDEYSRQGALDRACLHGSADACLARGNNELDDVKARGYFEAACSRRSAEACQNLAFQYIRAEGEIAAQQAANYARQACDLAPTQCFAFAFLLLTSTAIPHDRERAAKLLTASCDTGSADGCELAAIIDRGHGTALYGRTADALAKSCDAGAMSECVRLAELYGAGNAVPVGASGARSLRASELLKAACREHTPHACRDLAFYHADGAEGIQRFLIIER